MILDVVKAAAMLLLAAVAQLTVLNPLEVFDGPVDLLLCTLVAIALLRGAAFGALAGFWAGLIVDTASLGTLGLISLLLVVVGYAAGWFGEATSAQTTQFARVSIAVAGASALFFVGSALVTVLLDDAIPLGSTLVRSLVPTLLLNLLIAYPVFLVLRWLFPIPKPTAREVVAAAE
jgi:rod shape-determining protein MreD